MKHDFKFWLKVPKLQYIALLKYYKNDNNITNFNSVYFSYKWIQILNLFAIDLANRYESIEVIKTSKKAKERIRHDIYDMEYLLFALAEGNFATKEDKLIRWFKLLSKDGTCITNKI